jgi:polyhydroxyalkanoate synthesis regulator phasin
MPPPHSGPNPLDEFLELVETYNSAVAKDNVATPNIVYRPIPAQLIPTPLSRNKSCALDSTKLGQVQGYDVLCEGLDGTNQLFWELNLFRYRRRILEDDPRYATGELMEAECFDRDGNELKVMIPVQWSDMLVLVELLDYRTRHTSEGAQNCISDLFRRHFLLDRKMGELHDQHEALGQRQEDNGLARQAEVEELRVRVEVLEEKLSGFTALEQKVNIMLNNGMHNNSIMRCAAWAERSLDRVHAAMQPPNEITLPRPPFDNTAGSATQLGSRKPLSTISSPQQTNDVPGQVSGKGHRRYLAALVQVDGKPPASNKENTRRDDLLGSPFWRVDEREGIASRDARNMIESYIRKTGLEARERNTRQFGDKPIKLE